MFKIKNFTDNDDIKIINELGPFRVLEYQRDLSVMPVMPCWPITAMK